MRYRISTISSKHLESQHLGGRSNKGIKDRLGSVAVSKQQRNTKYERYILITWRQSLFSSFTLKLILPVGEFHKAGILQNIIYFIYYLSIYGHIHTTVYVWRPGDNFVDSFFSFHFYFYVLFFISVAVINTLTKSNFRKKTFI